MNQTGNEDHQYLREKIQLIFDIDDQFVTKSRPHFRKHSTITLPPKTERTRSHSHHHSNSHVSATIQHQSPTES